MDENERRPEDGSDRVMTIRLTREAVILMAALAFLGLAIALVWLFPPGGSPARPTPTAVGDAATSEPTSTPDEVPTDAIPSPEGPTSDAETRVVITSEPPTAVDSTPVPGDPYPPPTTPTTDPLLASETPVAGLPTFAPDRTPPSESGVQQTPALTTPDPAATLPAFPTPDPSPESPTLAPTTELLTPAVPPTLAQPTPDPLLPTATARPRPTRAPTRVPTATPIPVDTLRGNIRWTRERSPIILSRDQRLLPGASLIIDPGVEVRLAPGVAFYVEGVLQAAGQPNQPVRFTGTSGQRWDGLYGRPGSTIILEYSELRGGGSGGTLLASDEGRLRMRNSKVTDNGGHVRASNSQVEVRDSEIAGNDMPYGAALDISLGNGGQVTVSGNRIGGNRLAAGSPPVQIRNSGVGETAAIEVQRNLLVGESGPNLVLFTNGPLQGSVSCNALLNGTDGLSLKSQQPAVPGMALTIRENVIDDHTPPIIPIYLKYGIGRGATSDLNIDMRENWWGNELGPYHPELYEDGRGDSVGANILFEPWLTGRPGCAPTP